MGACAKPITLYRATDGVRPTFGKRTSWTPDLDDDFPEGAVTWTKLDDTPIVDARRFAR